MLLAQQFSVLYPTGTATIISVAVGAAAPLAVSRLIGRARVPAPGATGPATVAQADSTLPGWHADRVVPMGGLPSYDGPALSAAPNQHLPAGLEVRVVEHVGERVHLECSNGWRTWVDAAEIGARATTPPPPPPA